MQRTFFNIIVALIFLSGCNSKHASPPEEDESSANINMVTLTEKQAKNVIIETCSMTSSQMSKIEKVNGSIDVPPQNLISVSSPMNGYLQHTKLLPGMRVSKGELIATISDRELIQLQQDYLTTKSKIHFAEIEYNRQKALAENEATSDKVLQFAHAELQQNNILLAALSEKLKLLQIDPSRISTSSLRKSFSLYSPIHGFVNKVNVNIGKYVSPSEVLFEIIDPSDIHLYLKVYEKVAQQLKIGQRVKAFTNTNPGRTYNCTVILINKEVNEDGLVDVHCHFEKYDPSLIVGMYMNAEIETESNLQNALPLDCITSFEGRNYVFLRTKPNSYEMFEVQTGLEEGGWVEIKNNQALEGKSVVSKGAYTLLMTLKNIAE